MDSRYFLVKIPKGLGLSLKFSKPLMIAAAHIQIKGMQKYAQETHKWWEQYD